MGKPLRDCRISRTASNAKSTEVLCRSCKIYSKQRTRPNVYNVRNCCQPHSPRSGPSLSLPGRLLPVGSSVFSKYVHRHHWPGAYSFSFRLPELNCAKFKSFRAVVLHSTNGFLPPGCAPHTMRYILIIVPGSSCVVWPGR